MIFNYNLTSGQEIVFKRKKMLAHWKISLIIWIKSNDAKLKFRSVMILLVSATSVKIKEEEMKRRK